MKKSLRKKEGSCPECGHRPLEVLEVSRVSILDCRSLNLSSPPAAWRKSKSGLNIKARCNSCRSLSIHTYYVKYDMSYKIEEEHTYG